MEAALKKIMALHSGQLDTLVDYCLGYSSPQQRKAGEYHAVRAWSMSMDNARRLEDKVEEVLDTNSYLTALKEVLYAISEEYPDKFALVHADALSRVRAFALAGVRDKGIAIPEPLEVQQ